YDKDQLIQENRQLRDELENHKLDNFGHRGAVPLSKDERELADRYDQWVKKYQQDRQNPFHGVKFVADEPENVREILKVEEKNENDVDDEEILKVEEKNENDVEDEEMRKVGDEHIEKDVGAFEEKDDDDDEEEEEEEGVKEKEQIRDDGDDVGDDAQEDENEDKAILHGGLSNGGKNMLNPDMEVELAKYNEEKQRGDEQREMREENVVNQIAARQDPDERHDPNDQYNARDERHDPNDQYNARDERHDPNDQYNARDERHDPNDQYNARDERHDPNDQYNARDEREDPNDQYDARRDELIQAEIDIEQEKYHKKFQAEAEDGPDGYDMRMAHYGAFWDNYLKEHKMEIVKRVDDRLQRERDMYDHHQQVVDQDLEKRREWGGEQYREQNQFEQQQQEEQHQQQHEFDDRVPDHEQQDIFNQDEMARQQKLIQEEAERRDQEARDDLLRRQQQQQLEMQQREHREPQMQAQIPGIPGQGRDQYEEGDNAHEEEIEDGNEDGGDDDDDEDDDDNYVNNVHRGFNHDNQLPLPGGNEAAQHQPQPIEDFNRLPALPGNEAQLQLPQHHQPEVDMMHQDRDINDEQVHQPEIEMHQADNYDDQVDGNNEEEEEEEEDEDNYDDDEEQADLNRQNLAQKAADEMRRRGREM
uniref:Trichohyalin-like n=1 Tax=Saccoglossus kowalevskii TaxID=10224 RepID=A0ABM0LTM4_SACKO